VTGTAVSGVLHLLNKTPWWWFSKRQPTVSTSTFESEYMASRLAVEQIIDLRNSLRYLGVKIQTPSYMFGDNEAVVRSSNFPDTVLKKRHTIVSFHKVREAIAAGTIQYHFISGKDNPDDILSKLWDFHQIWGRLQLLLFWKGDAKLMMEGKKKDLKIVLPLIRKKGESKY